ncbi:MAG TPA: hypothetical protein V6C65_10520, partial [Allocoleopsis sp.]
KAPFALLLSFHTMEKPSMDHVRFDSNVYHFPQPSPTSRAQQTQHAPKVPIPPLVIFQLVVTLGLSGLATFLQYEFYHEHDVLPGYAWPLAIAGTSGMLSLASMKFIGWTDSVRKLLYGACYIFMVLSSSFHVANKAWKEAANAPVIHTAGIKSASSPSTDHALNAMTEALKQATKNRAWKVMETIGVQVSKQIASQAPVEQPKPFGISHDWVIGVGALIIIVLRALLEGIQALSAVAVRNYLAARNSLS